MNDRITFTNGGEHPGQPLNQSLMPWFGEPAADGGMESVILAARVYEKSMV